MKISNHKPCIMYQPNCIHSPNRLKVIHIHHHRIWKYKVSKVLQAYSLKTGAYIIEKTYCYTVFATTTGLELIQTLVPLYFLFTNAPNKFTSSQSWDHAVDIFISGNFIPMPDNIAQEREKKPPKFSSNIYAAKSIQSTSTEK